MLLLLALLSCGDKDAQDDSGPVPVDGGSTADGGAATLDDLAVDALTGDLGTIAWVSATPSSLEEGDLSLQALRAGKWGDACVGASRCVLAEPADQVRAITADGSSTSPATTPALVSPSLAVDRPDRAFFADETVALSSDPDLPAGAPVGSYLSHQADGATRWWSDSDGWLDAPQTIDLHTLELSSFATRITSSTLTLIVGVAATDWASEADLGPVELAGLASAELTIVELGHRLQWGDPHVHSDLSQDGCEDPDSGCQGPDIEPASDLFFNAEDQGLDWAAMTDHAEWSTYVGSVGAVGVDVWDRQQEIVQQADEELAAGELGVVPFLGYEWTRESPHDDDDGFRIGGHRSVILEETAACDAYRIAARRDPPVHLKAWAETVVVGPNEHYANEVVGWRAAARDAAELCGEQRVLFIAHHPALLRPQPVDWRRSVNMPNPTWEPLVEIASEHGTSECYDLEAEHCDFRVAESDTLYFEEGSFQAALMAGMRFGVVGGTDAHDARGGSLDDGPSCTAIAIAPATLGCQAYQGAVTGVLTAEPHDRGAIFDGLFARQTYASTGPRLPVRAWLSLGGQVFLPGAAVEGVEGDEGDEVASVTVSLSGSYDPAVYTRVEIDLLGESGERLAGVNDAMTGADAILEHSLEPGDCSACYVRIRLYEDGDDEGERLWLSPWFR